MAREIRILHTGDTHIGYRQYHSEVRRQDFIDAFSSVIDDAIDMKVDAVVHAGDLFDSRNPTLEDILDTIKILSKLKQQNIPFLSIVGNHESKQNTQWLDLFESMDIASRLSSTPFLIDDVAVYGIDNVPRSKIPLYDYSDFTAENCGKWNLLVMHQLMSPFPFGEWDCEDVISSLPFDLHAMLLGDYHKHEKTKVGSTWATYCGSTERNSASESDPRTYNIITINDTGLDISRRNIVTRDFLFIPVELRDKGAAYELIITTIKGYDVAGKVVFLDISGNSDVAISYNEIEDFLAKQDALVTRIRDMRHGEGASEDMDVEVSFSDPDEAVKREIKNMTLTSGGIIIDEVVRDSSVPKTKVDLETESKIGGLLSTIDFSVPVLNVTFQDRSQVVDECGGAEFGVEKETNDGEMIAESVEKYIPENISEQVSESEDAAIIAEDANESVSENEMVNVSDNETPVDIENNSSDEGNVHAKPRQYNLGDYL
ncbi:exonuclease SbcCD subunit D [Methanococcoides sp. SA1]|nr:exonuclease SbcCD subunit D [Methanococcoides sp. SA1]